MNVIPIDPYLISSHLKMCSFLVFVVDGCVVSYPQSTITFCYDGDTLLTFCLHGYRLVTFCAIMDIYYLDGYYVNVWIFRDIWILVRILS